MHCCLAKQFCVMVDNLSTSLLSGNTKSAMRVCPVWTDTAQVARLASARPSVRPPARPSIGGVDVHARPAGLYGIGKLYLERVYACSALCAAASQNGFCRAGGRRHITTTATTATSATPIVSVQRGNDTLHSTLARARSRECVCAHTHTHTRFPALAVVKWRYAHTRWLLCPLR